MGRPRAPWNLPFDEVRKRYEGGASALSLAEACGLETYHPILRALREAGVEIRRPGGPKGPRRDYTSRRVVRTCGHPACNNTFSVYPSQNKVYCSPVCRYTSPEMRKPPEPRKFVHRLRDVDPKSRTGVCAFCGPTKVRVRTESRKYQILEPTWRCSTATRIQTLAKLYGLTMNAAEEILAAQDWGCAICRYSLHDRFYVDHDHVTGAVRGMLCNHCNTGLGLLGDTLEGLQAAVRYLETAQAAIAA